MVDKTQSKPRGRLLVVDDEQDQRLALVAALEQHGYDVTGFGSSTEALEALRAGRYDVLLADLQMPGMDGIALLRAGLEIDPNLVGLIMTGPDTLPVAAESLPLGTLDHLLKPINPQTILPSLQRALELRRARLENLQLRASEARYRELFEHATDGILMLNERGLYLAANARLSEWLGYEPGELVGRSLREIVVPDDLPAARQDFASVQAGQVIRGERRLRRKDGTWLLAEVTARRVPDGSTQAIIRDITERQRAEQALRASESRYRELIEQASDAIGIINGQGDYIEANSVLLKWLGYTREELLQVNTREVMVQDDQAQFQRDLDDMRAGKFVLVERRLRRKDGSWLRVEVSGRQLPDGSFQALMRDITERKQAEQALRESETRQAALFQASPAAISVTTLAEGRFVDVNAEFERLMGYTRAEVIGRTVDEVGTWAEPESRQWMIDQLAQHGSIHNAEQRFRRKSGEVIDVLLSIERIELNGEPLLVGLVLDITERKHADRALRDSEARFAALFQASPAAISLSTLDGRIVDVNKEFERTLGYGREEVVSKRARDIGTWAAPEERDRVVRLLAQSGSLAGVEVQYRRKSGEIMQALSSFETVELAGERYILTLALDITDRKRAEDQVRFQAGLLGAVGQAVVATDPLGAILYWNHVAEKMYGWQSAEVLGRGTEIFAPSSGSDARSTEILNRVRAGETWTGEFTMQRRDGTTFPAMVTETPFYDRNGVLAGIIGLSTDISERKQRERELEAIGQLSAALRVALTAEQIPLVILDQLAALFGADAADLSLLDPARGEMRVAHAAGRWAWGTGTRTPASKGIGGRVVATGKPYLTNNAASDPLLYPPEAAEGIGAVAVLPLIAHGQTIGTLAAGRPAPFGEGDLRLLGSIADITANALQRATLHEQTRLRADQLAAVNELARALAETLLLEQIYERLDAATRQLLPAVSTVVISLYDPELQLLSDVYRAQDGRRLDKSALPWSIDDPAVGAQAEVVRSRRPVIVDQADARLGTRSSVLAPLLAKGEVIGVLQANSPGARGFGRDEANLLATVANTAAVAIENARLFAQTQRRLLRLQALRTIDLAITSSMDSHISLRVLVDQAATHLGVDAVDVLLLDNQSHRLEMAAGRGFRTPPPRLSLRVDEGIAGRAFMERRLLRVQQLSSQPMPSVRAPWIASEGFVAYFGMPLVAKGLARGVLEVFHRAPLAPDAEWIDFLETLAEQAAIAVDNSWLFTDLQRSNTDLELAYDTTLEGWSRALDLRDKETEGHTQRVTDVTERLARAMGLTESELVQIRRGALLHDIGKMGIPDSILLKPGPLTADEWTIMRKHPLYAFDLLAPIAYLRPALDIPYCHHEKWDGTGYPRGLQGDVIPLAARVFAVVDVWDALRSDRPYRPAWPEEQVREHIRALAGTHFEPQVVEAFMALPVLS